MEHVWKVALLIVLAIIGFAIVREITSTDDTPSTTTEDHREAAQDWLDAGPEAQYIVCQMWLVSEDSVEQFLKDTNTDEGVIRAKLVLIERECVI